MKKFFGVALIPVGLVVLAWPCFRRHWALAGVSNKTWPAPYEALNGRRIDGFTCRWKWFQRCFHNPEDGDSGQTALIWVNGALQIYNPTGSRWKAYCWSAWRNSVDGLKY